MTATSRSPGRPLAVLAAVAMASALPAAGCGRALVTHPIMARFGVMNLDRFSVHPERPLIGIRVTGLTDMPM